MVLVRLPALLLSVGSMATLRMRRLEPTAWPCSRPQDRDLFVHELGSFSLFLGNQDTIKLARSRQSGDEDLASGCDCVAGARFSRCGRRQSTAIGGQTCQPTHDGTNGSAQDDCGENGGAQDHTDQDGGPQGDPDQDGKPQDYSNQIGEPQDHADQDGEPIQTTSQH